MNARTFLLPALGVAALAAPAQTPEVRWRTDLAAARAEAKARNLPLFVVFRCER